MRGRSKVHFLGRQARGVHFLFELVLTVVKISALVSISSFPISRARTVALASEASPQVLQRTSTIKSPGQASI